MPEKIKRSSVAAGILRQLKDPFDPKLVKYTPASSRMTAAYIDARDVMKRLDDVMGTENWQDKYIRTDGGFICELSLRIEGEWLTKSNVSNDTNIAPQKGGASGAFKRAAVEWGIGRYLYYFDLKKYNWSEHNVKGDWPKIFLPGAPEDWEKIAQREYGESQGMDEESYSEGASKVAAILETTTREDLLKLVDTFSQEERLALEFYITAQTQKLIAAEKSAEDVKSK